MSESRSACRALWLGRVDYKEAWAFQREIALRRARNEIDDTLLLLEHPPVYTTGRRSCEGRLLVPESGLGAPLLTVDRGGDVTFHGPGQLVAYPIVALGARPRGVQAYVRGLEASVIRTLAGYGVKGGRIDGVTGVWVGEDKIAAIGVRVSRPGGVSGGWVTSHGLALNVSVELEWFQRIVPCGLTERGVTSMDRLVGSAPSLTEVAESFSVEFGTVFGREVGRLELLAEPALRVAPGQSAR